MDANNDDDGAIDDDDEEEEEEKKERIQYKTLKEQSTFKESELLSLFGKFKLL